MGKFIFFISFLCLFFCGSKTYGQTTYDTTVSEVEAAIEEPVYEEKNIDTNLYFHTHFVPADSVEAWRNSKAFAYTKYLDSLLKSQETVGEARTTSSSKKKNSSSSSSSSSSSQSSSSSTDSFFNSPALSVFLWILAACFILFILYKLFLTEGIFKKNRRSSKDEQGTPEVSEEVVTSESDFDRLIRLALASGNYRLAVRYQYLRSLHQLATRNYVELAVDKTNYQYVQEISNHQVRNDFASLTLNYEYVWYGEFQIEQTIYQKLETAFQSFNQKV